MSEVSAEKNSFGRRFARVAFGAGVIVVAGAVGISMAETFFDV